MADAKELALPVEVENLLREAQEVPLGPNDAKELHGYIFAKSARIKELEAERDSLKSELECVAEISALRDEPFEPRPLDALHCHRECLGFAEDGESCWYFGRSLDLDEQRDEMLRCRECQDRAGCDPLQKRIKELEAQLAESSKGGWLLACVHAVERAEKAEARCEALRDVVYWAKEIVEELEGNEIDDTVRAFPHLYAALRAAGE